MTQEDKKLLLKDLCARLPYGVMVHFEGWNPEKLSEVNLNIDVYNGMGGLPIPYLRLMSSMTDEERLQAIELNFIDLVGYIDWLNEHHFDYRGLIEKGLAIAVTDENNPYA